MATRGDAWEEVATSLEESSALGEGGVPKAADVGLFRVELSNAWLEVSSTACDRRSQNSAVMLMWLSALGGCSIVRWVGEVGVKVLWGAEALGAWSPGVFEERSTSRKAESLNIHMPWVSDSGSGVSTRSRDPFNP